ncbi:MAG: hypothetical protein ABJA67_07025 [Chthonomonadales bacterium]
MILTYIVSLGFAVRHAAHHAGSCSLCGYFASFQANKWLNISREPLFQPTLVIWYGGHCSVDEFVCQDPAIYELLGRGYATDTDSQER